MEFKLSGKKVVILDLDGTLAKSKQPLDREMAPLLAALTKKTVVAVIGGGKIALFRRQVLAPLRPFRPDLRDLRLFPTNGAALYRWNGSWKKVYESELSKADAARIKSAVKTALTEIHFKHPRRRYGPLVEDRGAQITFSALGQRAPLLAKMKWNRKSDIRPVLAKELKKLLPGFNVQEAGLTSVDVTKEGIDKGYAIRRLMQYLHLKRSEALFVGDAISPGGNDYPAKKTGIPCLKVSGPEETKQMIKRLLD